MISKPARAPSRALSRTLLLGAAALLAAPAAFACQDEPGAASAASTTSPESAEPATQAHPPVPADWPADVEWIGEAPPDPLALAAHPEQFAKLLEEQGLGVDLETRTVTARGGTLHDTKSLGYPIEYVLVTDRGRTHEALFVLKARPSILDACLRAVGLRPGTPMRFRMKDDTPTDEEIAAGESPWEAVPSSGPLVSITIAWTDDTGVPRQGRLESMMVDSRTRAALPERDWTYVGGRFGPLRQKDKVVQTHVTDLAGNVVAIYLTGDGLCLFERNSLDGIDDSLYSINPATAPPRGTPVTILFAPTGQEVAPPPPPPTMEVVAGELGAQLDAALAEAATRGFSGAVHVARGGQTLLEKGYGVTAEERGSPITGATVFPLEALSRRIVAAAALRAGAAGTLSLDASLSKAVHNVPVDKIDITARMLLEQRSGLPYRVRAAGSIDRDTSLRGLLDGPMLAPPGEACLASDAGYALLVATLEDAAEDTWRGYLGEHVFGAARMTGADLCGEPRWEESRLALGNQGRDELQTPALAIPDWMTLTSRGIVASARDLGRFERWLDAESAAFVPACDTDIDPWRVVAGEHGRCLQASGHAAGFQAELRRWLDQDTVLIVLANVEQPHVTDALEALLFPGDAATPPPAR